jgi:phosphomannomutase
MERLRAAKPTRIGSFAVEAISDYEAGTRVAAGGATSALTLPKSNVLTFDLAGGTRVIARPSGTEPKLKIYFDVREAVQAGEPMADADGRARQAMAALSAEVQKLAGVA